MHLSDYPAALQRWWILTLILIAVPMAAALVLTLIAPPVYDARAQVFVTTDGTADAGGTQVSTPDTNYLQQEVASLTELATSSLVTQPVIDGLGLDQNASILADQIVATSPEGTTVIRVDVSDDDAKEAADIANGVAGSLRTAASTLQAQGSPVLLVTTVDVAATPGSPSSPNLGLNLVLSLLVGVVLALLAVAVLEGRATPGPRRTSPASTRATTGVESAR